MRKAGGNIARGKTIGVAQVLVFPTLHPPFQGTQKIEGDFQMDIIELKAPSHEYAADIWQFRQEILEKDAGSKDQFAGCGGLENCTSAEEWIERTKLGESDENCEDGKVPSHMYLAVRKEDNRIVGLIDLRHHIDHPVLGTWGGHSGYSVRPSERGHGYAKEMLRQLLPKAGALGIRKFLITCKVGNLASEKTILANGGVFEGIVDGNGEKIKRFWISIDA